jgi:hypothetical protein
MNIQQELISHDEIFSNMNLDIIGSLVATYKEHKSNLTI